ncbi:biotin/lipoyl-binding protein [Bacillus sp. REN16]|uniref:biotin/lipoyl-binding protein n=1 Tax=Bacillus sp. REN16 TaxID=2887296 RepID=UPI001E2E6B1F|nr:biotin/lipoyl-binding protein [Bacillus sp. REN16]MCC3357350.1 HlyD family efflux transporter periplasmic adaptor subunit [Bacillus sp. REN16]
MKKKKVLIWILSIVGVLAIAGGAAAFLMKEKSVASVGGETEEVNVTVQKAKEQELIETILVTGEIVPEGEQKVFLNPEHGEISEYKVDENQTVKAGDPLFVYDSSKLDTEITRATRERDLIQTRAKTEQNQIAALNKRIEEAKKALAAQKNKPKSEAPETEEGTEPAQVEEVVIEDVNQLTSEKVQMELQYENTKSEITAANERITEITNQKKEMTVVSKIDGVIVKINKNVSATEAGANEPVIHTISNKPYKVIGTMSEFDAVKIQQGQEVIVRPKVFKDREWKGAIETVSHFPNETGGGEGEFYGMGGGGNVTMYPFKVAITDDTSELRHGFHVSLEVRIPGTEILPVIPHTAILDEGGVAVVYVLADGLLQRREVQTGSMNDEFIQVTEGVTKDELVVITPYEGMYDGMEVTSFDEIE